MRLTAEAHKMVFSALISISLKIILLQEGKTLDMKKQRVVWHGCKPEGFYL
jgi:hypothetical protein